MIQTPTERAFLVQLRAVAYPDAPDDACAQRQLRECSDEELHLLAPEVPDKFTVGGVTLSGLTIQSFPRPVPLGHDGTGCRPRSPQGPLPELSALLDVADDFEADTLVDVAIRAGLLWRCSRCSNTNPLTDSRCDFCDIA